MREQLEKIAAMIMALPHSDYPTVCLGTGNGTPVESLLGIGAHRRAHVNNRGSVIVSATITIGGVEFAAQYDRPATAEEMAKLAAGHHHHTLVTASL